MGKPCIVGCAELKIDYDNNTCTANGITIKENDMISIDGSIGTILIGEVPTVEPKVTKDFQTILSWAQNAKQLGIRAKCRYTLCSKTCKTVWSTRNWTL